MSSPIVQAFFDPATTSLGYVVHAPGRPECVVIDPVLDFDPGSGRTGHAVADDLIAYVRSHGLQVQWILETHAHADHLSGAQHVRRQLGGRIAISARIIDVQRLVKRLFNLEPELATDGSQFDRLLADGDVLYCGDLRLHALHVPGHTPACMAFQVGDAVFVGDVLWMPDLGTARCDFPGSDAATLYASIRRLLSLPPQTRLFVGHDDAPRGRPQGCQTTVAEQRRANVHARDGISKAEFVALRKARDAALALPARMLPALQVNIRAGALPPADANGVRYLRIPVDAF